MSLSISRVPTWVGVVSLVLSVSLSGGAFGAGPEPLDEASFKSLQEQLTPDASDTWRQIPWKISVLEGQRVAASDGKPLFIWAMDGHPLGCT
jgi:hypothetical protein